MIRGFTLLEVLMVIACLTIVVAFTTPFYGLLVGRTDLDATTTLLAKTIRRAEFLSRAVDGDSAWGVQVKTGSITLFKGATYATRAAPYDLVASTSPTITIASTTEYDFNKFYGTPVAVGTTTLTASSSDVRTVVVNGKGTVSY